MRAFRLVGTLVVVWAAFQVGLAAEPKDLVVIPQSAQEALIAKAIPVTFKASAFFLAEWTAAEQEAMRDAGIPFDVILRDVEPDLEMYLFELHDGEDPPLSWRPIFRQGRNVIVVLSDEEAEKWSLQGQHPVRLWHEARGWGKESQKQLLVPYDCTFKPLISDLLGKATQAQWTDWIEKLSGVETVQIDGNTYQIDTRFTATMFSGATNAKGYDFVRQQAQAWKFSGGNLEEDPFSTGPGGKNLVLTIPGQNSTSQVLLTAHLDSIWQVGNSSLNAPGANDNGTGAATLLEAARLLRQYRFDRTIKIIFWTGEEQGLFGSAAYTVDHAMGSILGVLNLDMFGWDLNGDRCFEIHNGTMQGSVDIGSCFSNSIGTYGLNLSRDFLTSSATNRSDHASFWSAGVPAIEIAENFFSNGTCPQPAPPTPQNECVCPGVEANPNYHTNNDKLATNMHPSYAHSIAKAGLATIAAMAVPIQACFTSTPAISAVGGTNQVEVSWAAVPGASAYRVYRAGNGCGGNFVALGETAATSYVDPLAVAGTYAYKIEAVTADGQCFSAESNCVAASPTVYHATTTAAAYTDTCPTGGPGNGDGYLDPGEVVTMPVTLQNDGNTSLSAITGTLSSPTAGVAVLDPTATWPDLAPSTSAQTDPDHFRFQLGQAMTCGSDLALNVQATAAEGSWNGAYAKKVGQLLPGNATVLNESFSGGIPATWTVVDGLTGGGTSATWTTANPGSRTLVSPIASPAAIVDSDRAGSGVSQDEQLITPVLDLSGAVTVILQFDQHFNFYESGQIEKGDVDVRSSLTGNAWVNVFRNQGADSANPDHRTINLTAQAAGAANVQIRFHYYDATFEWWWIVDNVRVDITSPAGCLMNPCAAAAVAKPVAQMTASRVDDTTLDVDWVATCASTDHELLYGDLATVASYALAGSVCGVGTTGSTTWSGVPAGDLWFLVTGVDGAGTEASWGSDSAGNPRNGAGASGECGNSIRNNAASCP
jgi:hypothetical protein